MNPAAWVSALVARARLLGPIPAYGSPAWSALPLSDPRAVAAVAVAAECWRQECDPERIAERLRAELAAERRVDEQEDAEELARIVRDLAARPTFAQLCDRRGGPERAARARARADARPTVGDLRDAELVEAHR